MVEQGQDQAQGLPVLHSQGTDTAGHPCQAGHNIQVGPARDGAGVAFFCSELHKKALAVNEGGGGWKQGANKNLNKDPGLEILVFSVTR